MKDEFIGFYKLTEPEYKILWENATFVFDANVLLNLYRYRKETSDELIGVMERLKDRVWVPYHAALEFQRNRLGVIAKQNTRFAEVRKAVKSLVPKLEGEFSQLDLMKRHSTINTETLLTELNAAISKFSTLLEAFEKEHFSLHGDDHFRDRLENIFKDKLGQKPESQQQLNDLAVEAERRFKNKIPPGYMDDSKDKSDALSYTYGGLTYQSKYGDFIIWEQLISHAAESNLSDLIFVTDDGKEDWLLKINQEGEKTIGPRPELIEELSRRSRVKHFNIYNSAQFLEYANRFLQEKVSSQAIQDATNIVRNEDLRPILKKTKSLDANSAFLGWLSDRYGPEIIIREGASALYDFSVLLDEKNVGFYINIFNGHKFQIKMLRKLAHALSRAHSSDIEELTLVIIIFDIDKMNFLVPQIASILAEFKSLKIILGAVFYSEGEFQTPYFVPYMFLNGSSIHAELESL